MSDVSVGVYLHNRRLAYRYLLKFFNLNTYLRKKEIVNIALNIHF